MKKIACLPIILVVSIVSKSQIYYSAEPIKNYFTFYKNDQSIDRLNDSITTSFFKRNDTAFVIKFYINKKFKSECQCIYQKKERKGNVSFIESSGDKHIRKTRQITIRELIIRDKNCISFLPKSVLKSY